MNRSVITLRGLDILNNSIAGGDTTQYWIGYYGLAYIPEENRQDFSKSMVTLVPRVNEHSADPLSRTQPKTPISRVEV